ncbi:M48 family metallopeptidase [Shewanella glacialipiscicola]|uniref:M48 family metallopeptidase n=1 Tax=Shewanella glacialipiscicola TaxID=614069 RepID=UPI003D799B5A
MKSMRLGLVAVSVVLGLTACMSTQSPTGRGQTLLYSSAQMQQMGDASFEEMKKQQKVSSNTKLTQYVNCVANRVTAVLPDQTQRWDVVLFDSEQVNAFALPGGHIGVYTGLLKVANGPDQLATVLGHEVAHVLAQHGNEQVSRGQLTGVGMQIADAALGVSGVANRDLYMSALGLGAQVGVILPFGRAQESEADIMGLELMARAGFDPAQSVQLWQNMSKVGGSQGPELLSTHPSNSNRIEQLQQLQAQMQPLYATAKAQVKNQCVAPK